MKKMLLILAIFVTHCVLPAAYAQSDGYYKVLKVVDGDTMYVDFNGDDEIQKDEKVRLNAIDAFEISYSKNITAQAQELKISEKEVLTLGYLGREFARGELEGKFVQVTYSCDRNADKYNRHIVSIHYEYKNFEEEMLTNGYALAYRWSNLYGRMRHFQDKEKIKSNLKDSKDLKLAYLNQKNGKYHRLDCKYAQKASDVQLVEYSHDENFAKCCSKSYNFKSEEPSSQNQGD